MAAINLYLERESDVQRVDPRWRGRGQAEGPALGPGDGRAQDRGRTLKLDLLPSRHTPLFLGLHIITSHSVLFRGQTSSGDDWNTAEPH